jgi:hypothetical protein
MRDQGVQLGRNFLEIEPTPSTLEKRSRAAVAANAESRTCNGRPQDARSGRAFT